MRLGLKSSRGPTKTTTSSLFFFFLLIGKSKGAACVYLPVPKFYPTSLCEHGGGGLFRLRLVFKVLVISHITSHI